MRKGNDVLTKKLLQETERVIGRSMPDYARAGLLALLRDPSAETWDTAHSLNIGGPGFGTLWQALRRVFPEFPTKGPITTFPEDGDDGPAVTTPWRFWPVDYETALAVLDVASIHLGDEKAGQTYNAIMARAMS